MIGQTTLHWGRMEFGNIGNYYIIEPLIRGLHRVFKQSEIVTTFQMSNNFIERENIKVLPMDLYYSWGESDLDIALMELSSAYLFGLTGYLPLRTPYIDEVMKSDLIVDFSGDLWGDNADLVGKNRFLIGLLKDRVAQLLGKKTVMIAGSPGPFEQGNTLAFAQEVFRHFDLVTNREALSINLLENSGFDVSNVVSLACPSFLFEPKQISEMETLIEEIGLNQKDKKSFGFILCGWNFLEGPFDKWPRSDDSYIPFAEAVEYITEKIGARVYLMSHSNGFPVPPAPFELIHGRDYYVIKQLESVLKKRGIAKDFHVVEQVLDAWQTKAIISQFDVLVSGRIHGAVAGLSQCVPTVVIDYGHEPKAHKLRGFAIESGVEQFVADPAIKGDLIEKIQICWEKKDFLRQELKQQIPLVRKKSEENFLALKRIIE